MPTLKREARISDERSDLGMFYETVDGAAPTDWILLIRERLAVMRRNLREYSREHEWIESVFPDGERRGNMDEDLQRLTS